MNLQRTPFDNDRTLLYKWSQSKNIPVRLTVVRKRTASEILVGDLEPDKSTFHSLRDLISSLPNDISLRETYFFITDGVLSPLKDQDIVMVWFEKMTQSGFIPDELNDEINAWYKLRLGKSRFKYTEDLEEYYAYWLNELLQSFENDRRFTENIIESQEKLSKYPPTDATDITVKSSVLNINVKFKNGQEVSSEDGPEIFNSSLLSSSVPFISYLENITSEKYLNKIYLSSHDRSINFDQIYIPRTILKSENTLYLKVYKFDDEPDLASVQSDDFNRAELKLSGEKQIMINSTPKLNNIYMDRLRNSLPDINLGNVTETRITGEFIIPNMDIFVPSFLDIILREPLFNIYLYLDEIGQAQALKQKLTIKYHTGVYSGPSDAESATQVEKPIGVSIKTVIAPSDMKIQLSNKKELIILRGNPYLVLTVNKAANYEAIQEFMIIFRSLISAYQQIRKSLDKVYSGLFPILKSDVKKGIIGEGEIREREIEGEIREEGEGEGEIRGEIEEMESMEIRPKVKQASKLSILNTQAPQIFKKIKRYGSKCQLSKQPIIISPDNVNTWMNQTFELEGKKYKRQVMPFPPNSPEVILGCDSNIYPFPGVIENKHTPTEETFPYIPCCFESDQMDPGAQSLYNIYYKGREITPQGETKPIRTIHRKSNILEPYRLGYIPVDLEKLLKKYHPDTEGWWKNRSILRMGVPMSNSSFLHSICEAVADPGYINLPIDEREEYIINLREFISSTTRTHILKQELWDLSDNEILKRIADPDVFFDPLLFYRCVEELFNVNIYVFGFVGDTSSKIEVPRHKIFHASTLRKERPVILIMRHTGTGRETVEIPQCELLIDIDIKKLSAFKVFSQSMLEIVHNIFSINNNVITFSMQESAISLGTIVARNRIYSRVDFRSIFRNASKIWVDEYGKMRALVFSHNGKEISVSGLPAQPENLPLVPSANQLPLADVGDVIEVFGNPIAVAKDTTGLITGLWYPILDILFGVFVGIKLSSSEAFSTLPIGPPNPLKIPVGPSLERIRILRKLAALITQLAEYLFDIYRKYTLEHNGTIDPDLFSSKYMISLGGIPDPLQYYNLNSVPKFLPKSKTVEEAIEELTTRYPTYFNNGKLILYNETLKRKMAYYIRTYFKQTEGLDMAPRERIDLFIDEEDFRQTKEMNVFLTEKDLDAWIKSQKLISTNLSILNKLDLSQNITLTLDPFLYQNPNTSVDSPGSQIYFIQNVIGGNPKRALLVAKEWYNRKVNIGPGSLSDPDIKDSDIDVVHVIYGIGLDLQLTLIVDNSGGKKDYLELIYYGQDPRKDIGGRYGSLLPLL